jgi:hypothetical protein
MRDGDIVISNWDSNKGNFIYYNDNNPVGLDESNVQDGNFSLISISPQPADDHINVRVNNSFLQDITLEVTNISGQRLTEAENTEAGNIKLDVSQFPPGLYVLSATDGHKHAMKKFMIAR